MSASDREEKGGGTPAGAARGEGGGAQGAKPGDDLPRWLAPLLFGVVTLVLFRGFVFSDGMLFGSDTLSLGYAARDFFARALADGVFPFWNPLILGGTPFLDSLAGGDSLYPPSVGLLFLTETHRALGWKLVLHVFLAGCFMYGWLRALDRSRSAALLGGLAYLLAPFLVSLVAPGHDGKIFVTALTPLLFWAVERWFRSGKPLPLIGTALGITLVILTTHFQMAYFLFGAVGLYAIFRTVQLWTRGMGPGALLRFGLFLAASVVGAAGAAVQLLPAVSYVTEYSRRTQTTTAAESPEEARIYSSSWSLHPEEVVNLLNPAFSGNNAGGAAWAENSYWGRNPFKDNLEYAGVLAILLAGLAYLGGARSRLRWFLAGLGAVALLYGLGPNTPVWGFFYAVVPGVSLFRAPSIAAFLFGFSIVTLMAFGVDRALAIARGSAEDDDRRWRRALYWLGGLTGLLFLGALLARSGALAGLWTGIFWREIPADRAQALAAHLPQMANGFFIVAVLCGAALGALWLHRRALLDARATVALLALLVAFDGLRVDRAFIEVIPATRVTEPGPITDFLVDRQTQEPPFRVLDFTRGAQSNRAAQFGVEQAAGHHPNDLARYRELIGMAGSQMPMNFLRSPMTAALANVGYLVWPEWQGRMPFEGLQRIGGTTRGNQPFEGIYAFPGLPRARLVAEARVVGEEETLATVLADDFDPRVQTVLANDPGIDLGGGPVDGEVRWVEDGLNRMRLEVTADRPGLLVLSENWYPQWRATVDGEDTPVLRADHTFRAIAVPAGSHEVEFYYDPSNLVWPFRLSLLTVGLLLGAGGWFGYREWLGAGPDGDDTGA